MERSNRAASSFWKQASKIVLSAVPALMLASVATTPVHAAGVVFQFNNQTLLNDAGSNGTQTPSSGQADTSDIQSYMNSQLATVNGLWTVAVSGGETSGGYGAYNSVTHNYAAGNNTGYTGDSHVVCATNTSGCSSNTLAAIDGMPVIVTNSSYSIPTSGINSSSPLYGSRGDNAIKMVFSGGVSVNSLSFDFEIFPDGNCANGNSGGCSVPDFTFVMTTASGTVENLTVDGGIPGSAAQSGSGSNAAGTYSWSCSDTHTRSPAMTTETADQCIGSMSFTFTNAELNPTLYFIDWPDTVGVTNIDWGILPEPGTLALLGSGLFGLGMIRRRRRK